MSYKLYYVNYKIRPSSAAASIPPMPLITATDPDIWWHMHVGHWILQTHSPIPLLNSPASFHTGRGSARSILRHTQQLHTLIKEFHASNFREDAHYREWTL
jgi:hypothetical protein